MGYTCIAYGKWFIALKIVGLPKHIIWGQISLNTVKISKFLENKAMKVNAVSFTTGLVQNIVVIAIN